MKKDNIVSGFQSWKQPYQFLVCKQSLWDLSDIKILQVLPRADDAYAYWDFYESEAKKTIRRYVYKYILVDSFMKDAHGFCKKKYQESAEIGDNIVASPKKPKTSKSY